MHSVFINDHPLRFISAYNKEELELAKNYLLVSVHDKSMDEIISQLEESTVPMEIFYLSENADSCWSTFVSHCSLIEAAGGLVQRENGEFLVIHRLGKWDLPKGKMEYEETPEQAAIREVSEECGISNLTIIKKLPVTFHTYVLNNKRKLKKTHWYLMESAGNAPLVPQTEENIVEARWMNENDLYNIVLKNTYYSIAEMLNQFFGKI